jgi:tRNA (guanosine-2'-O-)-methyltransferase
MYELKQKLLKSDIEYKLNEEKLLRMKIRWAVNSIRSGQQIFDKYLKDNGLEF